MQLNNKTPNIRLLHALETYYEKTVSETERKKRAETHMHGVIFFTSIFDAVIKLNNFLPSTSFSNLRKDLDLLETYGHIFCGMFAEDNHPIRIKILNPRMAWQKGEF